MNAQQALFDIPQISTPVSTKKASKPELRINVIASGSKGNCTAVTFGKVTILLDAGIGFDRIQQAINFENPTAAIITHEHGDHANKRTLAELLKRGVKVYMTEGTVRALQLEPRHNLIQVESKSKAVFIEPPISQGVVRFGEGVHFYTSPAVHDAAQPISIELYVNSQGIAYIIDNAEPSVVTNNPDYLLIETNHSVEDLLAADIDERQKQRILHNHLSIEKAAEYIDGIGKAGDFGIRFRLLKEVHLIHISKRHGNAERFKEIVQNVVGGNVKVFVH